MELMFPYELIQRFTQTEISIYKYIQANREKIVYMTIREFAREIHLSTSSIVRFYNKIGCESYLEFKGRLREEASASDQIYPENDLLELLHYFHVASTGAFEAKIREGAKLLQDAELILFIGQGSSGTLAKYGARFFSNLGKFSIGLEDPYYPLVPMKGKKVAVIVLSVSGESKAIISFIDECRSNGVRVLSITNTSDSTIARLADWNIAYHTERKYKYEIYSAISQVPPLFLIETLARRI